MRLTPGTPLGPYEVGALLGAGGMGEVYRAKDTRLGRDVAIKVLPESLRANPAVHSRFEREARTISSLNHPHICTLHDVGREGDIEYLVMELVEGETLAQRLAKGPLPLSDVLRYGVQIADALDRAHRAGIVHRDFKPGNVMLTKSGAKLMDFGLARTGVATTPGTNPGVSIAQLTQSPTMVSPLTAEGTLVGTFLYMAPEQLEGKEADSRSDLWALGCTLFEMASGHRAFDGKSQAHLIGAIMHADPPALSQFAPTMPPALESLIRALLAKDPEDRIQTAHDVKLQLGWLTQSSSQSGVAAPELPKPRMKREPFAWAIAGVALLAAVFFGWRSMRAGGEGAAASHQIRFSIPYPKGVIPQFIPKVSPDGTNIVYLAKDSLDRTMIWLRPMNSTDANPLPGTENALTPFWSPDGRFIGFAQGGKMKRLAISGGPVEVVCDAPSGSDGTWNQDGVILYDGGDNDPIRRVNAAGGTPSVAMESTKEKQVGWPMFLPDGKHYLYNELAANGTTLMLGELGKLKGRPLGASGSRVEYSQGYLLFSRGSSLLAQKLDVGGAKLVGDPIPIAQNMTGGANATSFFSVSRNGVLVYRATGSTKQRAILVDREGRELSELLPPGDYRSPALSPDGSRLAYRKRDGEAGNIDVWVFDIARRTSTRFTFDPADDSHPLFTPDGSKILWVSGRTGSDHLFQKLANGTGADEDLGPSPGPNTVIEDISRDGKYVTVSPFNASTAWDLYVFDREAKKHTVLVNSPFAEQRAYFSPDGKYIAYESNESGRSEVYVTTFQGPPGRWQVSTNGGSDPCWSHSGRELFFLGLDSQLMTTPVSFAPTFTPGTPAPLFHISAESILRRNVYCPMPDDQRFVVLQLVGETSTPLSVVVNWKPETARR